MSKRSHRIAAGVFLSVLSILLFWHFYADGQFIPGFSRAPISISREGIAPLNVESDTAAHPGGRNHTAAANLSYKDCEGCHEKESRDWMASSLHHSFTNPIFQDGFSVETEALCVHCHAPIKEQAREILPILRQFERSTHTGNSTIPPLASEGINCAVCHVRGERIVTSKDGSPQHRIHDVDNHESPFRCLDCHNPFGKSGYGNVLSRISSDKHRAECQQCHEKSQDSQNPSGPWPPYHKTISSPVFREPEFCAHCHEFHIPVVNQGELYITQETMQSTYDEWTRYKEAGGEGDCVSCHMPEGAHTFPGTEPEFLRKALHVTTAWKGGELLFSITSSKVGHNFPTGDLFRHLTLEVSLNGREYFVIHRMGRTYGFAGVFGDTTPEAQKRVLMEDTSLKPFEIRGVMLTKKMVEDMQETGSPALPSAIQYRVRYHLSSPVDERRGTLSESISILPLIEGELKYPQ